MSGRSIRLDRPHRGGRSVSHHQMQTARRRFRAHGASRRQLVTLAAVPIPEYMKSTLLKTTGSLLTLGLVAVCVVAALAQEPSPPAVLATAATTLPPQVQPFLTRHCAECHGPEKAKAGFRIDQLSPDFSAPKSADH